MAYALLLEYLNAEVVKALVRATPRRGPLASRRRCSPPVATAAALPGAGARRRAVVARGRGLPHRRDWI